MQNTSVYDEHYFATSCGPLRYERSDHWVNFFGQVAEHLIRALRPSRVLDAGCAMGFLVESFWDRGVFCTGVDVSEYAISQVRRDMAQYCRVQSLTEPFEGRFDLITCIEVLEHIPPEDAQPVIANLCGAADTIFFSSTPTDFTEPTHVNVQPTKYWLDLFAMQGFGPDPYFDAGFLTPHAFVVRKGLNRDESVVRLYSEHIRLKIALQDTAVALNAFRAAGQNPSVELGNEDSLIAKSLSANSMQAVTVPLQGSKRVRLRIDPGQVASVTVIDSIAVRNALSGQILWAAPAPDGFESLQLGGAAAWLKPHESGFAVLGYGGTFEILLPVLDEWNAEPRMLTVTLRLDMERAAIADRVQTYLGKISQMLRSRKEEVDEARDQSRSVSESAAKTRYELSLARDRIKQLEAREAEVLKQLDHSQATIDSVLTSASWKATRPLRACMSLLSGQPR